MTKRKVTTIVTLEVKLTVPHKQSPGHVVQFVVNTLEAQMNKNSAELMAAPSNLQVQLIKKETTYG